jgi:hypothetical protein
MPLLYAAAAACLAVIAWKHDTSVVVPAVVLPQGWLEEG